MYLLLLEFSDKNYKSIGRLTYHYDNHNPIDFYLSIGSLFSKISKAWIVLSVYRIHPYAQLEYCTVFSMKG